MFPLAGAGGRYPPEGNALVWRSHDAGDTWQAARSVGRVHLGVDILAKEGNELYAVATG